MSKSAFAGKLLGTLAAAVLVGLAFTGTAPARQQVPEPALDAPAPAPAGLQTAVLAGGCFWGVEAVFEHVKGVTDVVSGYAGGRGANPSYYEVSGGNTGHAEAVRVVFDPRQVSYAQLLKVYFSVAHDPTQLNRQGPDHGTQYRSAIFYSSPQQQRIAAAYIAQMGKAGTFGKAPIVTQLVPLSKFWPAEGYHQDFARLNPTHPYIVFHDAPKVARLQARYPGMYRAQWTAQLAGAPAKAASVR
jgi:peptide-methionine (S)-S-oxide reductase